MLLALVRRSVNIIHIKPTNTILVGFFFGATTLSVNKGRNSTQKRKLKLQLFKGRSEKKCCFCKRKLTFNLATLEHIIPLSKDGGWNIENLAISCRSCNEKRGSQDFVEFRTNTRSNIIFGEAK